MSLKSELACGSGEFCNRCVGTQLGNSSFERVFIARKKMCALK